MSGLFSRYKNRSDETQVEEFFRRQNCPINGEIHVTDPTKRPDKPADDHKQPTDAVDQPKTKDREEVRKQYTNRYASRKEPSHGNKGIK